MDFKPGDVVRLKSGGPPMTIQSVKNYAALGTLADCIWINTTQDGYKMETGKIAPAALEAAKA